jgi:hypothetical protein
MSSPSLQPDHRATLWNNVLDADMNVYYWTLKCDAAVKWDKILKTTVALAASGTAIASLSIWQRFPLGWQLVSVAACIASIIHSIYFPSDRLTKISGLLATWKEISIDYELLWEGFSGMEPVNSWKAFEEIKRREKSLDESQFPVDKELREQAFQHVLTKRGLHE